MALIYLKKYNYKKTNIINIYPTIKNKRGKKNEHEKIYKLAIL